MASREVTLELLLSTLKPEDLVVACNGKIGREIFEIRKRNGQPNDDFILIGAMGCALGVAMGVARKTQKKVVCILGDGNFLMKMGSLATYRELLLNNLHVYIVNNSAHDSTGGQPTSFDAIRHLLPYQYNFRIVDVEKGARPDLGRPDISPEEITRRFMTKVMS